MRALLAPLLMLATAFPAVAQPAFPPLSGRVTDAANVIPPDVEARLDQKLAALEANSTRQLVVATIPSLDGYEISDYGYQLGRAWGIGQKGGADVAADQETNNGAILIVAPNERKVRIEVGYGLEPILTDGFSSDVVNYRILPAFKAGDLPGGIEAGVDAIITQVTLPPEQAARIAAAADRPGKDEGIPLGTIIWLAFVFFFFVLPVLRSMFGSKRGRRYRGGSGPIIWVPGGFGSGSGGGGFGGGGFGGGFSGGGGSFGGGGASGSW